MQDPTDYSSLPPPPQPLPSSRRGWRVSLAWTAYFVGEVVVLSELRSFHHVGWNIEHGVSPESRVNKWKVEVVVLTVLVVLGLALLARQVMNRSRLGRGHRSRWLASAAAGLIAIAFGVSVSSRGTHHCYDIPAPGFGMPSQGQPCGVDNPPLPLMHDFFDFYRFVPLVVVAAGAVMVLLPLIMYLRSRHR